MSTFAEIAARCRRERISYRPDLLHGMQALQAIEELARAMEVLEYNTAYYMACTNLAPELKGDPESFKAKMPMAIEGWLLSLQSDAMREEVEGW